MTPLPKRRHSTRRGGKRQAAIKLTLPTVAGGSIDVPIHVSHRAYEKEGYFYYNGKKIAKK
jgi:ribosomal protein L32